jgi:hypothetical protein
LNHWAIDDDDEDDTSYKHVKPDHQNRKPERGAALLMLGRSKNFIWKKLVPCFFRNMATFFIFMVRLQFKTRITQ